jgi:hypothetical protein
MPETSSPLPESVLQLFAKHTYEVYDSYEGKILVFYPPTDSPNEAVPLGTVRLTLEQCENGLGEAWELLLQNLKFVKRY